MRILQILPELKSGGVERGTIDFAKYLDANGHHSIVVSNGGLLTDELEQAGIKHYTLPVHKKSLFKIMKLIKPLRQIINDEKIDVVHARSRIPAWIAFFACRRTNAMFITTCHGFYNHPPYSQVMGWGKYVIVPSEIIAQRMIQTYKVPSNIIRVIPRSVDTKKFKFHPKKITETAHKKILMVGRITPLKGHEYFLKAMAIVARSMPYCKIQIVGDVPKRKKHYLDHLKVIVNKLALNHHVVFLGNRTDIPQLMEKADVLVMSSTFPESFGRVVIEAQAVGTPVVATSVGGVTDIIDHEETGLLVPPKDPEEMGKAVLRILKDQELAETLIDNAVKKVRKEYLLKNMADRTLGVYDELIQSMNILIIKLGSFGDIVLVTASLRAIKKKFPHAKISVLVHEQFKSVLIGHPDVDEVITCSAKKNIFSILRTGFKLQKHRFDKVIDFQNNKKSHLLAYLSFARETYGYDNGKFSFLLDKTVKHNSKKIGPVEHQFEVLKLLDVKYDHRQHLNLKISNSDLQYANELFESAYLTDFPKIVGINLGASPKWETKNWPLEHIAKYIDLLAKENVRVFLTGSKHEENSANELLQLTKSKPANFVNKTSLMQLAAIIKKAHVFVTPDSAPLHLAASVQTPFITFFGPTDEVRHLPPAKNGIVFNKKLKCSPCYKGKCPIFTHECLKSITPEEVFERTVEVLSKR